MPEDEVNRNFQLGFNETAFRYWSNQPVATPELLGVAAIGGGGFLEALYRHWEEVRHLTRLIPFNRDTSVLELGCGNGRWIESIAPLVKYYEAVDFSQQMIAIANERIRRRGLDNVQLFHAAVRDHTPTSAFEVVYLSGVSQYLRDDELSHLLSRLRNYLKPGGILVDRSTLHRYERQIKNVDGYASIYRTANELGEIFQKAGLTNVYHRESYTSLNFVQIIQRLLNRHKVTRLLIATAPLSFVVLRACANLSNAVVGRVGEMKIYSHDFMLFSSSLSDTTSQS
jgi:SAM-dependent methyltransferase